MTTAHFSQAQIVENNLSDLSENSRDPFYISLTSLYPTIPPVSMNGIPAAPAKGKPERPIQLSEQNRPAPEENSTVFTTPSELGEPPINDHMTWSKISIFFGAIILGLLAVALSAITKQLIQDGHLKRAKIMSRITLGVNLGILFLFVTAICFLMIYYTQIK